MSDAEPALSRNSHRSIHYQSLAKIYTNVQKFAGKNGTVTKSSQACSDLTQLLQYLCDDCSNVCSYSFKLLYCLVEEEVVCKDHLISLCVSQSALGRPVRSLTTLVLHLLQLKKERDTIVPIEMHPFSRILMNQSKSAITIFSAIQEFLISCLEMDLTKNTSSLKDVIASLKPFISYVITDGTHLFELFNELMDVSSIIIKSFPGVIIDLVVFITSCLSTEKPTKMKGAALLQVLQRFVVWYLDNKMHFKECHLNWDIINILVSISWDTIETGDNSKVYTSLHLIKLIIQLDLKEIHGPNVEDGRHDASAKERLIFVFLMMLLKVDDGLASQILQIIMLILPNHLKTLSIHQSQMLLSLHVLPMLQILSEKKFAKFIDSKLLADLAENIMTNINVILKAKSGEKQKVCGDTNQPTKTQSEILNIAQASMFLLNQLLGDKNTAMGWCLDLCKMVNSKPTMILKENIVLNLSALMVYCIDEEVFRSALEAMMAICKHNCNLVMTFLPVLLYLLRSERHRKLKLDILFTFPRIATGKMVISSILKVILSLCESRDLLPVGTMLMTTLWIEQPRVFPYLLQLLRKPTSKELNTVEFRFELDLARVSSILKICHLMPAQHGNDMVVLISDIMEELIQINEEQLLTQTSSCLGLLIEALKSLCVAQVIDIKSIWKAVVTKARLKNHSIVLQSLCSLLSCFPSFIKAGNEVFLEEIMEYLWSVAQNKDHQVIASAYKALSVFPPEMMKIKYLPEKVAVEICEKMRSLKQHVNDEEYDPKEDVCPGFGFMMLLHDIPEEAHEGFQVFLQAVLQHEVNNLPRGIGVKTFAKPVSSIYAQIPTLLQMQYEQSARPAILPGIAAGILCCFEPKISGMDVNNPSKVHLKLLLNRHKQMLDNLLQEFNIRQNDWHQAALAPRFWSHFMKKLYDAFIKGRTADLHLQKEKGEINDEDYFTEELELVKFWARDEITNQLRKASRGTPKLQGNSIFALVGLANAVISFEEDESKDTFPDQYIAMRSWLLKVCDTVMTVLDGNFKSKGKPFQWCQQVSSERSTASSTLSRCCAALAMSELVQPMLSIDTNRIINMIEILKKACVGSTKTGSVTQINFHCFIGWGLLLSRLSQEQFAELAGPDGRNAMLTSLTMLEEVVFKEDLKDHVGSVVGYGLAISSLFTHDTQKDSKVHAMVSYERLLSNCKKVTEKDASAVNNQAFCFALACTAMNAYIGGSISDDDIKDCAGLVENKLSQDLQSADLHISLGVLCYALLISNKKQYNDFLNAILDRWLNLLEQKETNIIIKIGCIKGIVAACGIDLLLFKLKDSEKFIEVTQIKTAIKLLIRFIGTSKDNTLCFSVAQYLGQLHLISQVRNRGEDSNVPQSYNYLKVTSVLSATFNSLLAAATSGPYGEWSNKKVNTLISCLNSLVNSRLPPVNWTTLLSPILRIGYDLDVKQKCIKFAIKFVNASSSLSRTVSSWLQPNIFLKMENKLQMEFFKTAPLYLTCLSNSEQRSLLEDIPLIYLSRPEIEEEMLKHILELWISILDIQCSIQSTYAYIMVAMKKLINQMDKFSKDMIIFCLPLLAKSIYLLLKENWENLLMELRDPKMRVLLQTEMLNHIDKMEPDHILRAISAHLQLKDETSVHYLLDILLQIRSRHSDMIINSVTRNLLVQEDFMLDSTVMSNLIICLLTLTSSSHWFVMPSSGLSLKAMIDSAFNAVRPLLLQPSPAWLPLEVKTKVQGVLLNA